MVLYKLEDYDPHYREAFEGNDLKGLSVYTDINDEKMGTVSDVLVDEDGHFRYLVVDLGFWIFGKKVLLPIGRTRIDYQSDRVYTTGLTRAQAEGLPEFNERLVIDEDYEERVRGVYSNPQHQARYVEDSTPVETPVPVETEAERLARQPITTPAINRDRSIYEREPSLFGLNEQDHQTLKLYEERLIASKHRQKTGEVSIGKNVQTETSVVSVPVNRERIVIERVTPEDAGTSVSTREASFREGEVARMEIHEETPEIRKEAFVREEVRVKKVVDQETIESQQTLRREELDVNTSGLPIEER